MPTYPVGILWCLWAGLFGECFGELVELELTPDIANSPHARNLLRAQVDCFDVGLDNLDVTKNTPDSQCRLAGDLPPRLRAAWA
jgi:hypothetical protein